MFKQVHHARSTFFTLLLYLHTAAHIHAGFTVQSFHFAVVSGLLNWSCNLMNNCLEVCLKCTLDIFFSPNFNPHWNDVSLKVGHCGHLFTCKGFIASYPPSSVIWLRRHNLTHGLVILVALASLSSVCRSFQRVWERGILIKCSFLRNLAILSSLLS